VLRVCHLPSLLYCHSFAIELFFLRVVVRFLELSLPVLNIDPVVDGARCSYLPFSLFFVLKFLPFRIFGVRVILPSPSVFLPASAFSPSSAVYHV